MIVAFSIGKNSAKAIATLKTLADNIDFYSYDSIQSMIKEATLRHISFDRMVFSDVIIGDPNVDLPALNDFIKNYSDSTEVVMISRHDGSDKVFSQIFNSPMYTPVIMERTTTSSILELVRDDILSLRTRYYVLDVDSKDKAIVSSDKSEEVKNPVESTVSEPPKKGIFSGLKGLFRKDSRKQETVNNTGNVAEAMSEVTENVPEEVGNFSAGPAGLTSPFGSELVPGRDSASNDGNENSGFDKNVRSTEGEDNFGADSCFVSNEDLELSVGDYGSQHSDTGFLDQDDEEELRRFAEERDRVSSEGGHDDSEDNNDCDSEDSIAEYDYDEDGSDEDTVAGEAEDDYPNVEYCPDDYDEDDYNEDDQSEVMFFEPSVTGKTSIDIVVSTRGSHATQLIVDEAVKLVNEHGIKVLIVDLDTKENSVLSYIDVEKFYVQGAFEGISKHRIYEEDGIGIVSNGYGVPVSKKAVSNFFTGKLVSMYDMVLVDCPAECLGSLGMDVLQNFNVLLIPGTDISDMVAMSMDLTNREVVDLDVEKYIMGNCNVEFSDGSSSGNEEFVGIVRSICLFANGSWLDRIA